MRSLTPSRSVINLSPLRAEGAVRVGLMLAFLLDRAALVDVERETTEPTLRLDRDLFIGKQSAEGVSRVLRRYCSYGDGMMQTCGTRTACQQAPAPAGAGRRLGESVAPDDLVVLFLAGHGMVDDFAGQADCYLCDEGELSELPASVVSDRADTRSPRPGGRRPDSPTTTALEMCITP
jgi:hypothetical protein